MYICMYILVHSTKLLQDCIAVVIRICIMYCNTVYQVSLAGRKFGDYTLFKRLEKKNLANE